MPCAHPPIRPVRRRVRSFRRRSAVALIVAFSLVSATNASAQQVVYDPAAYGQLIAQARTGLQELENLQAQLAQVKSLYASLNKASGVNGLAQALSSPALRDVLPDASAYVAAAKGDFAALGALGQQAARIRGASRRATPSADDPQGQALARAGDRAARDLALGEAVGEAGAQRLRGLEQLQQAVGAAPDARAVLDLQARLTAEQAMSANDQLRLQGLAITQAAEARLAAQHAAEQVAADNATRLAHFRAGFR